MDMKNIYIYEDGEYYIGQWKIYKSHVKETQYESNSKIKKGKWLNDVGN